MSLHKDGGCWQCWCDSDDCKGSDAHRTLTGGHLASKLSVAEHEIDTKKAGAVKWLRGRGWTRRGEEWFCPACSADRTQKPVPT